MSKRCSSLHTHTTITICSCIASPAYSSLTTWASRRRSGRHTATERMMDSRVASCNTAIDRSARWVLFSGRPATRHRVLVRPMQSSLNRLLESSQDGEIRLDKASYADNDDYTRLRFSQHQRKFSQADYDVLPHRIVLLRHAESQGNVEKDTYCNQPDHTVRLTDTGRKQAIEGGKWLRNMLEQAHPNDPFKVFFMTSPYCRTLETTDLLLEAFTDEEITGVRSAVQLREQDFGNFQDPNLIRQSLSERLKFGRFWFRFPNGESGADVYDRLSAFEDHLTRDMLIGRYADTSLVLVTHGLTLRIFLMRWFHWSVDEFSEVYNPNNCDPIILEKLPWEKIQEMQGNKWIHAKQAYAIIPDSIAKLKNCKENMVSYYIRKLGCEGKMTPRARWEAQRGHRSYWSDTDTDSDEKPVVEDKKAQQAAALGSDEEFFFPTVSVDDAEWWREGQSFYRMDDN